MSTEGIAAFPRTWNGGGTEHHARAIFDRRSAERKAVETVLRGATPEQPISAGQVGRRCGLSVADARVIINNICHAGLARNVRPAHLPAMYAWRDEKPAPSPAPEWRKASNYDGKELRPYEGRPGAMDAYALPSLVDGQRVPRQRPMLIDAIGEPQR